MFESVKVGGRASGAALIVGQFQGKSGGEALDPATTDLLAGFDPDGWAAAAARRPEATGAVGSYVECFPGDGSRRVLIVGLGKREDFSPSRLRQAAAAAGKRLAAAKEPAAEVAVHLAVEHAGGGDPAYGGQCFGEGLGLLAWNPNLYQGSAGEKKDRPKLQVRCADRAFQNGIQRGLDLAESTNIARTLSQTPPNICTTTYIAEQAQKLARETGLRCTVFQGAALEREKFTGLRVVGAASENPPLMIRLEYTPGGSGRGKKAGKKTGRRGGSDKPLVLVGKTMTYDSGGLSLKINNGMKGMKRDKDGGCAVFGAMHAIATVIRPNRPVVALLSVAENSVSDEAYRPDDVITFRNGVTVEVTNTDAEGRLVLADALIYACEKENPAAIVDLATLTGGVVVALGSVFAGMWCDDDALRARVEAAADRTDERVWRLPHDAKYRDMMKSQVADIVNSAPVREAHPIQGAAFLSYFVREGIPWCHLDIAGVHATDKDTGPFCPGPTGWGVRLLAELVAN